MSGALRGPGPAPQPMNLPETVPALFQYTAARRPDQPALFFKSGDRWVPINCSEYGLAVKRLGNALLAEGLHPRDPVAISSAHRPDSQIGGPAVPQAGL